MDEPRSRGLRWRVPAWIASALLLDSALFLFGVAEHPVSLNVVFVLMLVAGAALASAFGFFGWRTSRVGKAAVAGGTFPLAIGATVVVAGIFIAMLRDVPPELMRGATDMSDAGVTDALVKAFPNGTYEDMLVDRLEREGFWLHMANRTATHGWSNMVCATTLHVAWTASAGHRVTSVKGHIDRDCL